MPPRVLQRTQKPAAKAPPSTAKRQRGPVRAKERVAPSLRTLHRSAAQRKGGLAARLQVPSAVRIDLEKEPDDEVESDGSSGDSDGDLPPVRHPGRDEDRSLRQRRKLWHRGAAGSECLPSVLEELSVKTATRTGYRRAVNDFINYMEAERVAVQKPSAVDAALVGYMTKEFFRGCAAGTESS